MGSGILPATIHNGKLYFLFGKENRFEKSAPGFSDFGGGTENGENYFETAVREAEEEMTGFLGNATKIRSMLKKWGTFHINYQGDGHKPYRVHIFPMEYNPWLPHFYNNNQQFLQKRLPEKVFRTTKIFEKAEIRWICINDLPRMRNQFRFYFRNIVDEMLREKENIFAFVKRAFRTNSSNKSQTKYTRHNRNKTKSTIQKQHNQYKRTKRKR